MPTGSGIASLLDGATGSTPTISSLELSQIKREFLAATPFTDFEFVDVTFPVGANTDKDIRTTLTPDDPNNIDYLVIRADRACAVYHDQSGTRRVWQRGYVVLRCNTANAVCTIMLFIRRTA